MNYLLFFHIGPVQGFISTARRTYDLWAGSWILSELCRVSIESLSSNPRNQVIYPVISNNTSSSTYANYPNKFMAILEAENEQHAKAQAEEAEKAVREYFKQISQTLKEDIERYASYLKSDPQWNRIWENQTDQYFEIYWVLIEFETKSLEDSTLYTELQKKIHLALDSRKLIRNFQQKIEHGPRCSLCGVLEQLTDSKRTKTLSDYREFWSNFTHLLKNSPYRYVIKSGERLCAVCLTKRTLSTKFKFKIPSTSSIAVSNLLFDIATKLNQNNQESKEVESLISDYYGKFSSLNLNLFNTSASNVPSVAILQRNLPEKIKNALSLDGDAFILETLEPSALKKYTDSDLPETEKISRARDSLSKILSYFEGSDRILSKYYALIMADGDNIGKIMSGSKGVFDYKRHREISQALSEFASKVIPHVVETLHRGKIIYWGGDEGLALCCLEDLVDIMHYIRTGFTGQWKIEEGRFVPDLSLPKSNEIRDRDGEVFAKVPGDLTTLSIGAVIAHHQESLLRVVEEAREALERAKRNPGKDSFSITIIRRSGESSHFTSNFEHKGLDILDTLKQTILFYREGLSDSWIYDLKRDSQIFKDLSTFTVLKEILRIISRRKLKQGKLNLEKVKETFNNIFHKVVKIDYFVNFNEVASYIAKGGGS